MNDLMSLTEPPTHPVQETSSMAINITVKF